MATTITLLSTRRHASAGPDSNRYSTVFEVRLVWSSPEAQWQEYVWATFDVFFGHPWLLSICNFQLYGYWYKRLTHRVFSTNNKNCVGTNSSPNLLSLFWGPPRTKIGSVRRLIDARLRICPACGVIPKELWMKI